MSRTERTRRRMLRRRRRTVLLAVAMLTLILLGVRLLHDPDSDHADASLPESAPPPVATEPPTVEAEPTSTEEPSPTPTVTERGDGTFEYAEVPDNAAVIGDRGELMTYKVAVEEGIDEDPEEFAEYVDRVFKDDRGWTAGDNWRFQHSDDDWVGFTIYLVSPQTRADLCGAADTFTSCRNGDKVVINLARWLTAVEHWDASLEEYREYVINHEVGHRLGEGHVVCPQAGKPSPVMAQQTLGLHGCKPNAWPYVNGEYLTGPMGEYE